MARLLRRQTPQLTVSLAFIHAYAVQRFLQTWYSAASLINSNTYVRILQGTQRLFRTGYQACVSHRHSQDPQEKQSYI